VSNYKFCFLLSGKWLYTYIHTYIYVCIYTHTHNTWEHLSKYSNLNSSTTYKTSRKLANYHLRTKLDMSLKSKCDPICRIITWCFYIHWQFIWTFKNKTHIQNWHDRRSCDYRNTFGTAFLNNVLNIKTKKCTNHQHPASQLSHNV